MKKEIVFTYSNRQRCHASIVLEAPAHARWVGNIGQYEVYSTYGIIFNQFGFVAVKKRG